MNKNIKSSEKKIKLLLLQRDYIIKAALGIDEILAMAVDLEKMEDPELIKFYLKKMDEIESNIDTDYDIACKIESSIS